MLHDSSSPVTVMAFPFPTIANILVNLSIPGTITLTLGPKEE